MKAQFIFEDYPSEDSSWMEFDMNNDGFIDIITKIQVSEDDTEELARDPIDPMILDEFLLKELGLNYKEVEELGLEEEFSINNYSQQKEIITFKTNLGEVKASFDQLSNLADKTRKTRRTIQKV